MRFFHVTRLADAGACPALRGACLCAFLLLLAWAAGEDLRRRRIPDGAVVCILGLGLLCWILGVAPWGWELRGMNGTEGLDLADRLGGFLCVSLPLTVVCCLAPGAFGGGDIKLAGAGGFVLGWRAMLAAGALAFLAAGAVTAALLLAGRVSRRDAVPFGPFLCLGMAAAFFGGEALALWYTGK